MYYMDRRTEEGSTNSFISCDMCVGLNVTGTLFDFPIPYMPDASFEEEAPKDDTCTDCNNTISDTTSSVSNIVSSTCIILQINVVITLS